MSSKATLFLVFTFILNSVFFLSPAPAQSGVELTKKMFLASQQISTLKFTLVKRERIEGVLKEQKSTVKLIRNPYKVYLFQEAPKKGIEVLYVKGENNDKAVINPNGFPWFNISLDPTSNIMRENQHHTLYEAGFDHVISILQFLMNKYDSNINEIVKLDGAITWGGKNCYRITFDNPNFKYISYTVKPNETIPTIAEKFKISGYMIMEKNKIAEPNGITAGMVIQIPNDYARKLTIYLDKASFLPLVLNVYDDKGVYEEYEYLRIEVNPPLKDIEFSKEYAEYGF